MKNRDCSWREMQAARQLVSSVEKGDGDIYRLKPCLNKSTFRDLRQIAEMMDVLDTTECAYAHRDGFAPSHARELAKHYRKTVGKDPAGWSTEVKDKIAGWVERCEGEKLTVQQLRKELMAQTVRPDFGPGMKVEDLASLAAAGKRFACIYADPPWCYGNQGTRAATDKHYPTMTVDEIAALPVGELAAAESHLWLWTTNGFLFECPRLFDAWGFGFKSSYVWVKPQIGIGNYLRNSHEFLLLAVRGGLVGAATDVRSWGEFDRSAHSAKPERVRTEVVERVSPGPRLELFARALTPGWTAWGNEIARGLFDGGLCG